MNKKKDIFTHPFFSFFNAKNAISLNLFSKKKAKQYNLILNNVPFGIILSNYKGEIVASNKLANQITGYDSSELEGTFLKDYFEDSKLFEENLKKQINDSEFTSIKFKHRNKSLKDIEFTINNCNSNKNKISICTIRDLANYDPLKAKLLKMEQLFQKKKTEFLNINEKLNLELNKKNDSYQIKYKELQKSVETLKQNEVQNIQKERWISIGQLSAGIAHEINNPLGIVENNIFALQLYISKLITLIDAQKNVLSALQTDKKYKDKLEGLFQKERELKVKETFEDLENLFSETQDGILRMTEIIKSLKAFSRMQNNQEHVLYNINEGLRNTLNISRYEFKYSSDIKTKFGNIPEINCDPGKLNQVFLNIIINAAQAIKSAHKDTRGLINIKTYADEEFVYCEISDNGHGISEDIQKKIFDPFFTTKDPKIGTGLGLSLSYDIIQKHNGKLWVESIVDEGTTFHIRLPIN